MAKFDTITGTVWPQFRFRWSSSFCSSQFHKAVFRPVPVPIPVGVKVRGGGGSVLVGELAGHWGFLLESGANRWHGRASGRASGRPVACPAH